MRLDPFHPAAVATAVALGVALSAVGCGSNPPSRTPLGWGPLPEGARSEEVHDAPQRRASRPSRHTEASSPASKDAADASSEPEPTAAETKAGSGTKAPAPSPEPRGTPAAVWAGQYRGEDVAVYHLNGIPDRTEKDPNARTTVKEVSADSLSIVLIDSSNGNEICALAATVKNGKGTISEGQHCFDQSGGGASLTASITSGTATLDGTRLHVEARLDVEMHFENMDTKGTLDYRFDGTRQ